MKNAPTHIKPIDDMELMTRIELNFNRLNEDYYRIENIFSPADYTWYADKEGRALLAFVSHLRMSGREIPCMNKMLALMGEKLNEQGFFGPILKKEIHEQQLSGHSWLLRGLCEYYEYYKDEFSLRAIRSITENLYLTKRNKFRSYPIDRAPKTEGGVMGSDSEVFDGWILSSDIGCAFMSIDGVSHAYTVLKDERIRELVDEMISVFLEIDKVKLRAQTHCTLTAARGMMRMYRETENEFYLDGAKTIMDLYVNQGGMSATYQNLNWWGRPETWTEPCAVVDSFMAAGELYKLTKDEMYRTLAARIYHNGLATAQRQNGGAGTDSVVVDGGEEMLYAQMYEAYFCCTMRLAEGLRYVSENKDLFTAHLEGCISKKGRIYSDGDIIFAEVSEEAEVYGEYFVESNGHRLCPIIKYYKVPDDIVNNLKQRILF